MRHRGKLLLKSLTIVTLLFTITTAWAATEKKLHNFGNGADGTMPLGALVSDANGNLCGTTSYGGSHGLGTAFELSPRAGGGWTETVLHNFGNRTDGANPGGGLIFDGSGNLYGTTKAGGIHNCGSSNCGTVFELSPRPGGSWTESVLHSFGSGTDGISPISTLVMDPAGKLYGTTWEGGHHGLGTVFELSPRPGTGWSEAVLHSFGSGTDGAKLSAGLVFDQAGNLYGTTWQGGIHGLGTAFELTPRQGGGWSETVLHSFGSGADGAYVYGDLILDVAGDLYGVTVTGGIYGGGTAFELLFRQGGGWSETILHSFGGTNDGAALPYGTLIFDTADNLYGTSYEGGGIYSCDENDCGAVFELSPKPGGWTEKVLHSFGRGTDGTVPISGVIMDAAGNLYGTTQYGGSDDEGTVFEVTP